MNYNTVNYYSIPFLFYANDIYDDKAIFDKDESHHCIKVLRNKAGNKIWFTNGKGYLYEGIIVSDNPQQCIVQIISFVRQITSKVKLTLAVSLIKNNSRYEWFLEKVAELGIYSIQPLICERTYKLNFKKERAERIILSAMKQSLNTILSKIQEPLLFNEFCDRCESQQKFIAFYNKNNLHLQLSMKRNIDTVIAIGPEGDFSDKEIKMALNKGFVPVNLGNSRLRSETAAIVSGVIFNSVNNI
ncbi:MAG TPA: RsmE family RNA methyltransferase [Bacteroidales bacterium]|nr:RsmE family RNA methyltransferase [Bacteroidales bacterium]